MVNIGLIRAGPVVRIVWRWHRAVAFEVELATEACARGPDQMVTCCTVPSPEPDKSQKQATTHPTGEIPILFRWSWLQKARPTDQKSPARSNWSIDLYYCYRCYYNLGNNDDL